MPTQLSFIEKIEIDFDVTLISKSTIVKKFI